MVARTTEKEKILEHVSQLNLPHFAVCDCCHLIRSLHHRLGKPLLRIANKTWNVVSPIQKDGSFLIISLVLQRLIPSLRQQNKITNRIYYFCGPVPSNRRLRVQMFNSKSIKLRIKLQCFMLRQLHKNIFYQGIAAILSVVS